MHHYVGVSGRVVQHRRHRSLWPVLPLAAVLFWGGCMRTLSNRLTLPDDYTVIRGQLVFHSDFPLATQHRLLEELAARRRDLGNRLEIPLSDEPIHVHLFENNDRFDGFVRLYHPRFPARRAFFLETDTRLSVYAQWGDRIAEDLRHEVTHGYLHASIQNLPLWLDEGLAEYFEVPRGTRGLNRPHLDLLSAQLERGDWQPSLLRLESFDPAFEMTQQDYAEAWAWVYFMLETPIEARGILPAYLLELRQYGTAAPISVRLRSVVPEPERELLNQMRLMVAAIQGGSRG